MLTRLVIADGETLREALGSLTYLAEQVAENAAAGLGTEVVSSPGGYITSAMPDLDLEPWQVYYVKSQPLAPEPMTRNQLEWIAANWRGDIALTVSGDVVLSFPDDFERD